MIEATWPSEWSAGTRGTEPGTGVPSPGEAAMDIVRRAVAAYNAGGIAGLKPFIADDLEWRDPPELPDADTYHGWGGLVEAVGKYLVAFGPFRLDLRYLSARGSEVKAVVRLQPVGPESLVPRETGTVQVYRLRGDRIAAVHWFFDSEDVRETLGIPPAD